MQLVAPCRCNTYQHGATSCITTSCFHSKCCHVIELIFDRCCAGRCSTCKYGRPLTYSCTCLLHQQHYTTSSVPEQQQQRLGATTCSPFRRRTCTTLCRRTSTSGVSGHAESVGDLSQASCCLQHVRRCIRRDASASDDVTSRHVSGSSTATASTTAAVSEFCAEAAATVSKSGTVV